MMMYVSWFEGTLYEVSSVYCMTAKQLDQIFLSTVFLVFPGGCLVTMSKQSNRSWEDPPPLIPFKDFGIPDCASVEVIDN